MSDFTDTWSLLPDRFSHIMLIYQRQKLIIFSVRRAARERFSHDSVSHAYAYSFCVVSKTESLRCISILKSH